ncbi:hypothetical protein [Salisediminibacterium selenitireducens]|uniref:CNNM transmembrane domain-containing protein n=1 Tax=Bacillus selenitireducens (strain ATCC 700615 / DSM 15326 / MLS10) TaxID=439292 RepID=D6XW15_BACIE|nr:hypothetical protein [Salisediminibacterium selenitireducens]ADH99769.1 hypothetical protein Bsel_2265 [[Bacillus] selenitireducens MLS10]
MKPTLIKSLKWSGLISIVTLFMAAMFAIISTAVLSGVNWAAGMFIVIIIVFIGVFSDTIGVAATAASERPFHAMAAEKVPGSRHAVAITRNADRFSNFTNDVIGDIAGVISGTASAYVVLQLALQLGHSEGSTIQFLISVLFTSVVAALTVGGKSVGKTIAIQYSTEIIYQVGRLFYFLEVKLNITIFSDKKQRKQKSKLKNRK